LAIRLGVALWNQVAGWPDYAAAARRLDELGYDHIWTWDHQFASSGDPDQDTFDGPTLLTALGAITSHAAVGLLVGANSMRNPGLVAKATATLDQITGGRAILGIGAGWFELEHRGYGIEFGRSVGERLDWLDEALTAIRALFAGEAVTSPSDGHYRFEGLRIHPLPVRGRIPILIGGSGERKTLRIVAKHADMWNLGGTPEDLHRKDEILREHCAAVGRDESEIERTVSPKIVIRDDHAEAREVYRRQLVANSAPLERLDSPTAWLGTVEQVAERAAAFGTIGFRTIIVEMPHPFDTETLERLVGEVKPLVEAATR
jgi:alkanesulfonate monooxygenase SsuD/methylene tetrahydromethanopterin reductase-like flavin-dependent oxidoreductase (luciferase family)